jgi:hypothetical protein
MGQRIPRRSPQAVTCKSARPPFCFCRWTRWVVGPPRVQKLSLSYPPHRPIAVPSVLLIETLAQSAILLSLLCYILFIWLPSGSCSSPQATSLLLDREHLPVLPLAARQPLYHSVISDPVAFETSRRQRSVRSSVHITSILGLPDTTAVFGLKISLYWLAAAAAAAAVAAAAPATSFTTTQTWPVQH